MKGDLTFLLPYLGFPSISDPSLHLSMQNSGGQSPLRVQQSPGNGAAEQLEAINILVPFHLSIPYEQPATRAQLCPARDLKRNHTRVSPTFGRLARCIAHSHGSPLLATSPGTLGHPFETK